jgi:hypothetical protein
VDEEIPQLTMNLKHCVGTSRAKKKNVPPVLKNKELLDLYSSPSIIRIIKSRRMIWARNVVRMVEKRKAYKLLWESQRERDR